MDVDSGGWNVIEDIHQKIMSTPFGDGNKIQPMFTNKMGNVFMLSQISEASPISNHVLNGET
jgi:hypothetical protein